MHECNLYARFCRRENQIPVINLHIFRPTSLDATVFAYLAPMLNVPLPNPVLQEHVKAYENLESFVHRILRTFPKDEGILIPRFKFKYLSAFQVMEMLII